MTITSEALRELHHLHQRVAELKARLDRGPKQIRAGEANVKKAEDELEAAKLTVKKAKMASDERNLQLKSNEARIKDLKTKLNQASSNKEYQALKEQIAADEMATSVLSDEIIEMLDKIDEHEKAVKVAHENLGKVREELDRVVRRVGDEQQSLEQELAGFRQRLDVAEAKLPADFKVDYNRVVKARGSEALAPLEGEICGGCHVSITPQMINNVLMSKPVFCNSCGCLLYLPEKG